MGSIAEALQQCRLLDGDSATLDAELLLCEVLGRDRTYLRSWPERVLTETQSQQYRELLNRRRQGEPVAYLLGRRCFWSLDLKVSPDTLIPRPDTETLVEQALALNLDAHARVLDMGTGTGAIALALANERPDWQVMASDCFPAVIALASENVSRLGLKNVSLVCSHWFDAIPEQGFQLIVCNPPYIDEKDPHLSQGDLKFEPLSALVAGDSGMADIRHIINYARHYLDHQAWLLLEHGYQQGLNVRRCFEQEGYAQVQTIHDLGGNERVTMGRYPG